MKSRQVSIKRNAYRKQVHVHITAFHSAVDWNYVTCNKTDMQLEILILSEFWLGETNNACFHSSVDPSLYTDTQNHFCAHDLKVQITVYGNGVATSKGERGEDRKWRPSVNGVLCMYENVLMKTRAIYVSWIYTFRKTTESILAFMWFSKCSFLTH